MRKIHHVNPTTTLEPVLASYLSRQGVPKNNRASIEHIHFLLDSKAYGSLTTLVLRGLPTGKFLCVSFASEILSNDIKHTEKWQKLSTQAHSSAI